MILSRSRSGGCPISKSVTLSQTVRTNIFAAAHASWERQLNVWTIYEPRDLANDGFGLLEMWEMTKTFENICLGASTAPAINSTWAEIFYGSLAPCRTSSGALMVARRGTMFQPSANDRRHVLTQHASSCEPRLP